MKFICLFTCLYIISGQASTLLRNGRLTSLTSLLGENLFKNENNGDERCDANCQDKNKLCAFPLFSQKCNTNFIPFICPKSCNVCKPCKMPTESCSEECFDSKPSTCDFAGNFCDSKYWGSVLRIICKKSCGICKPCKNLSPQPICITDCIDDDHNCAELSAPPLNYCKMSSPYSQWMLQNCRRSCKVCTPCDSEAPHSTILKPPLPNGNTGDKEKIPFGP